MQLRGALRVRLSTLKNKGLKKSEKDRKIAKIKINSSSKSKPQKKLIKNGKIKRVSKKSKLALDNIDSEKIEVLKYNDFLSCFGDNFDQKRAVVSKSDRILVLAGAGSGKTKVLTKRFVHLVNHNNVSPNNILALTFTKPAAEEMRYRIASELGIESKDLLLCVKTFHSFGFSLLKINERFTVVDEKEQTEIITEILNDLSHDEKIMYNLYHYLKDNVFEKVKAVDSKYSTKPQIKTKPTNHSEPTIKTDSGILVRSKSERDIANLLYSLGINFEYEKTVNWADASFKPDFTLNDDVFLEHWCYNDKTPEIYGIDKKKYLEHRTWKEEQFKKHNKTLISVEEFEMKDLHKLYLRLIMDLESAMNTSFDQKSILDIIGLSAHYKMSLNIFVEQLIETLNLAKSQMVSISELKRLVSKQNKTKIKQFYSVLIPVMEAYEKRLNISEFGKKDFNDLIKHCVDLLKNNSEIKKYYNDKFQYILVDEFQDVSKGEVELLKLLIGNKTKLFVVGDDWQSIYGWRGSDVNFILNFESHFGKSENIILPINYRSTKNIVEASTHFIQLSKKQCKKNIKCSKEREQDLRKIVQVNASSDQRGAEYIIRKVFKMKDEDSSLKDSDFLVLCRSVKNAKLYKDFFHQHKFNIPLQTIHWSKGKEAKIVFVIGLKGGIYGFPTFHNADDIKKVILDISLEKKDEEERRIFYVAMTRARDRLFLISQNGNESNFVTDIPANYKFVYREERDNNSF